ncbi:MAG TPA: GAF domain-containing protein, partial [Solirubrobacterales bacterium]
LFWLGGSWGLSDEYREALEQRLHDNTKGPAAIAVKQREVVVIRDARTDDRIRSRETALAEGLRSLVATPLITDGEVVGVLTAYRAHPDPWTEQDLDLIQFFADHCGNAIRAAALLDRRHSQLYAMSRIVRDLRELNHEHANRIAGISGLLGLGETAEARRFAADLLQMHHENHRAVVHGIEQSTLAGLLLAEMTIARQRGINLKVDRRSRLRGLPPTLTDAEAVTIVVNLITQAIDAVVENRSKRRLITFYAATRPQVTIFRTRHDGNPSGPLGESALIEAVSESWGTVRGERDGHGLLTVVEIPNDLRPRLPDDASPSSKEWMSDQGPDTGG